MNRRWIRWSIPVLLTGVLTTTTANAQPQQQPTPYPPPPPPAQPTREETLQQLRQTLEQLRQTSEAVGQQMQGLEQQLNSAQQAPAPAEPAAAQASNAEIAALRAEIEELKRQMEETREETSSTTEEILRDLEHRAILSGISATQLAMPQHGYPYIRAIKFILLANAQITPRLRMYSEIEFEDGSAIGEGEGMIALEQGFGEFILATQFGFRIGVVLVPFGKFNRRHESWRPSFIMRPMTNALIFPSTYSDAGIDFFGTLVRSDQVQLNYELAVVNGLDSNIMTPYGGNGFRGAKPNFATDNNGGKSVVGRLGLLLGEHLDIGVSGYWGQYTDEGVEPKAAMGIIGFDTEIMFRRFSARFEAIHFQLQEGSTMVDDDDDPETPDVVGEFPRSAQGISAEFELQFFPEFLKGTPLGDFDDPVFYVAGRGDFGRIEFRNSDDPREIILTAAIGYRPIPRSALRFEFAQGIKDADNPGLKWRGWGGEDFLASLSLSIGF